MGNAISDALASVKHITARVANALYAMQDNFYVCFTDLLYDMEMNSAFNATSITILIQMRYFDEFGGNKKLLALYDAFRNGDNRFSKVHVVKTQQARLDALRQQETQLPDETLPMPDQFRFEVLHYGMPITTYPDVRGVYVVTDVDEKYSPKITLYNAATANTGVMKVLKKTFADNPLQPGDTIRMVKWDTRPAYRYIAGKREKTGRSELWLRQYAMLR